MTKQLPIAGWKIHYHHEELKIWVVTVPAGVSTWGTLYDQILVIWEGEQHNHTTQHGTVEDAMRYAKKLVRTAR